MGSDSPSEFNYEYFTRLLETINLYWESVLLHEAPSSLEKGERPKLILRHDIDVSMKSAFQMAEIESKYGLRATYLVQTNCLLYKIEDSDSRGILRTLVDMGHEVGLHFDLNDNERNDETSVRQVEGQIHSDAERLENIAGAPVKSISFHRPIPQFLRGPQYVCGRVNAYSKELMEYYLADSRGRWGWGEPLPKVLKPESPFFQLNIHPIWWGVEDMPPGDRLERFLAAARKGKSKEFTEAFDASISATLPGVQRPGKQGNTKE